MSHPKSESPLRLLGSVVFGACSRSRIRALNQFADDISHLALFLRATRTQIDLDYPTGRILRDTRLYTVGAGTQEIRRMLIGREFNEELGDA